MNDCWNKMGLDAGLARRIVHDRSENEDVNENGKLFWKEVRDRKSVV